MPDGSRAPMCPLPRPLVAQAEHAFGVLWPHPFVRAAVAWMMLVREDRSVDQIEVANHYALWCFNRTYYKAFARALL